MEIKWGDREVWGSFRELSIGDLFSYSGNEVVYLKIPYARQLRGTDKCVNCFNLADNCTAFTQDTASVEQLDGVLEITKHQGAS